MFARLLRRSGAVARQMTVQTLLKGATVGADRSGNVPNSDPARRGYRVVNGKARKVAN